MALVLLLGILLQALPTPAAAQIYDLSRLLDRSSPEETAERTGDTRPPLQSLPVRSFDAAEAPSAADYARIAAEGGAAGGRMADAADTFVRVFRSRLAAIVERAPGAFGEIGATLAAASPTGRPVYFLGIAVFAGLLLVVGRAVAELYYVFLARPIFVRMQRPGPVGYAEKLPVLANRVLLGAVGTLLVIVVASLVGLIFYEEHPPSVLTVLVVFGTYVATNLAQTVWRMILAPYLPEYRLTALSDIEARRLFLWVTGASFVGIGGAAFCYWVEGLGLPREVHVLVTSALMAATVGLLLLAIRQNAGAVERIVLSGRPRAESSWITRIAASIWAPAAVVYLVFIWADLAFRLVMGIDAGPERILVPFLILVGGIVVYGLIMFAVERVFSRRRRMREINRLAEERRRAEEAARIAAMRDDAFFGDGGDLDADGDDEGGGRPSGARAWNGVPAAGAPAATLSADTLAAEGLAAAPPPVAGADAPDHRATPGAGMQTMEDLARRVASLVALGVAAYALTRYWGGADIFAENAFLGLAEDLIDVLLIGYVLFHAARIWLDRKIAEEGGDEMPSGPLEGEGGGAGATRLATLLPLVRNSILSVIAVTVALIVAMRMGVNVAPLFAGAGVVGLAIGFGAQTLVRDIISGAFFLFDDAFRKGEYIDVGSVKGTVEKISIRSFQLRHHLGMLHTIPFGEITHLTNFSRDWVMMKLPLRLTYDTDVEKVRKLVKKLGQELLDDPTVGDKFLQPLKSQGVIQMEDSAMIVRVKFMTRPGDQWVVRKRVYQDIRELFEREGIHFAHREVTVRIPGLPDDRELDTDERRAVGAAARAAIDIAEAEGRQLGTGTTGPVDDR